MASKESLKFLIPKLPVSLWITEIYAQNFCIKTKDFRIRMLQILFMQYIQVFFLQKEMMLAMVCIVSCFRASFDAGRAR